MASPGLSLVGFIDDLQIAIPHLQGTCVPVDPDPAALVAEWQSAKAQLGPPMPRAGHPEFLPLPAEHLTHIQQLSNHPPIAEYIQRTPGIEVHMVEIDPLLAYQATIYTERSDALCAGLSTPPTVEELLHACLPLTPPQDPIQFSQVGQSLVLKSRNLNFQITEQGFFQEANQVGIRFGISLHLSHVVRFNGRYYLHNGFHRAVGARARGATHMPCLVREVGTPQEIGIQPPGVTFQLDQLESDNPPTMGHFTQGRAHRVQLRVMNRIIHVSWAEHVMPDE